ncbi:hypothetical protein ES706_03350 [subsurface metagenome]
MEYSQSQFRLSHVRGIIKNMRVSVVLFTIVALMVVAVMPLGIVLAQHPNPSRVLPDTVYRGETFNVTVTFTSPKDLFNTVFLADSAPDGWNVTVDKAWCTPNADNVNATGNQVNNTWTGNFSSGTNFTALYKVTVPDDVEPRNHTFTGLLGYYLDGGGPQSAPIVGDSEVEVVLGPAISFSPSNLSFSAVAGGANPTNETLEIWNSGGGMLNWTLTDDAAWLSENATGGSSTGVNDTTLVTVSANMTGMSPGDYSANMTITAAGANNTPQVVPVNLHISVPPRWMSFSPTNLTFSAVEGGANPANETLEIWNSGGGMLNWMLSDNVTWLSEAPVSGNSTGPSDNTSVVVFVNITGMSAGNYTANINISAPGANNTPQVVPVSLHISVPPPGISFSPLNLKFSAVKGGAAPADKTLEIWNSGGGILNWSVSDDADYQGHDWLSESPTSGNLTGEHDNVTVSANTTGMSAGDYSANINISATGANNTPQVVPVGLHIRSPGGGGSRGPGGGSGGGSRYLDIDIMGKITRVKISYATGTILKDVVVSDANNTNFVEIERGTTVICDDTNKPPVALMMRVANQSPSVPDGSVIIGSVYNFTGSYSSSSCSHRNALHCCSGVSFDQNITIVLSYDPNELPESTASLAVAYYDTEQGSWVSLPTDIGRVAEIGKATGLMNHFSAVAIIAELAPPSSPASFVASGLNIEQSPQVRKNIFVGVTGENVTITANVANNGGQEGTYIAELKLNGETVDAKEVTLAAGQSQQVTFTLSGMDYGQYEVEVAGLSGEFTVSRSIDWWSIFDIIAAVGLITWGAIWWRRRRKPAQPAQSE